MFNRVNITLLGMLLVAALLPAGELAAAQSAFKENLSGHYSRQGNNDSPSKTSGNNIYIKFFDDRWLGMMFIPFPYAKGVADGVVGEVFDAARKQATGAAYIRGKYGLLEQAATIQIERYGYLDQRIIFECGSLSPCTIKMGAGFLELIKPGVINEHIVKYNHVAAD